MPPVVPKAIKTRKEKYEQTKHLDVKQAVGAWLNGIVEAVM